MFSDSTRLQLRILSLLGRIFNLSNRSYPPILVNRFRVSTTLSLRCTFICKLLWNFHVKILFNNLIFDFTLFTYLCSQNEGYKKKRKETTKNGGSQSDISFPIFDIYLSPGCECKYFINIVFIFSYSYILKYQKVDSFRNL